MRAPELRSDGQPVNLVEPNVERDAPLGVKWVNGEFGEETLLSMGNSPDELVNIHPTTLEAEEKRVKGFIERDDQLNWMIEFEDNVVGTIWVELKKKGNLPAPSPHIMIGDPEARGHGIGTAATAQVIEYLRTNGEQNVYTRHLVTNTVVEDLLRRAGFTNYGEVYTDDGLRWQNVRLSLSAK